jgi:cytochrome P450
MPVSTEFPGQASWSQDRPGSDCFPVPEPPYFDPSLDAWVFTRYSEITAALRHPSLVPASLRHRSVSAGHGDEEHASMRAETLAALPPTRLRSLRDQLLQQSQALVETVALGTSIDLISGYARPLCLSFAATVTGIKQQSAQQLCPHARAVSLAAADPYNLSLKQVARSSDEHLKPHFSTGPNSLRDSGFVGLSQTLPSMLGNIWFALLQHPRQWTEMHRNLEGVDQAIEELMRYVGFTRIITRTATADLTLNQTVIRKGDFLLLRLAAAHHDPEAFDNPGQIDLTRRAPCHLSFGAGLHSCVGAGLLRMASAAITLPLVSRFSFPQLVREIEWQGGAVLRFPQAQWVNLR